MKRQLLIISLLFTTAGFSQTISTEAPSVSASAVTVPSGFFQAESSLGMNINNDFSSFTTRTFDMPFVLLRYGIMDRLELRLQAQSVYNQSEFSNEFSFRQIGIGAKYAILPNEGNTNLAVIANFSPHINNWQSRQGDLTLAFSQSIGEKSSLGVNLGYSIFDSNSIGTEPELAIQNQSFLASAVYSYQLLDRLVLFGEFYSSFSQSSFLETPSETTIYGLDFGLQFFLRENIQLDYVSGFNLSNKEHFHSIGFNIYFDTRKNK